MKKPLNIQDYHKWIFRIMILAIMMAVCAAMIVLPKESNSFFSTEVSSDRLKEADLLADVDFFWVKDDGSRESVNLPDKLSVRLGETVVLEGTLPDTFQESAIIVRASQQDMRIYIAGKLRVDYNTRNSRPLGSQSASRYVVCKTGAEDAGKTIRIETCSEATDYVGLVNQVYACDLYEFWRYIFGIYGSDALAGGIIILIGLLTACISIMLSISFKSRFDLEFVGWVIFMAGVWLLCESKVRQLLAPNASVVSDLCFLTVMVAPYPFLIYVNEIQEHRYCKYYQIMEGVLLTNFFAQLLLQVLDIADYIDMFAVSQLVMGLAFALAIGTFLLDFKKKLLSEYKEICIGLMILMGTVVIEIVSTYMVSMMVGYFLTVGVFCFVCAGIWKTSRDIQKREKRIRDQKMLDRIAQSEAMSMQMIQTLSGALEAKDTYRRGHSERVAKYAAILAEALGMTADEIYKLSYAASLHDIGKISVPDYIMNKPGKLTEEEYGIVKTHTIVGGDTLKKVELIDYTEQIARYHHERYDGQGYPEHLVGEQIPYEARIVALADAYDAMNSDRIYRDAYEKDVIRQEIEENLGRQFDPQMGNVFLKLLDEGALEIEMDTVETSEDSEDVGQFVEMEHADKVVSMLVDTMQYKADGEDMDFLTGLSRRGRGEKLLYDKLKTAGGAIVFIDMDNLKPINDLYGHSAGDDALRLTAQVLSSVGGESIVYRQGGDEFLLYLDFNDEQEVVEAVQDLISTFEQKKQKNPQIQKASLSAGICMCSPGEDFNEVMARADKALYYVKHRGKGTYHVYNEDKNEETQDKSGADMDNLIKAISTAGKYQGAMELEYREFAKMYEYIGNLCERYKHTCQISLITLGARSGESMYIEDIERAISGMEISIRENIRNVDICTRYSSTQFLVILLEAREGSIDVIMERIFNRYHEICPNSILKPSFESRRMVE